MSLAAWSLEKFGNALRPGQKPDLLCQRYKQSLPIAKQPDQIDYSFSKG
jgi:hypothetical protein